MLTLVDAPRCPYCARVRILLAEKGVPYEPLVIDLDDRPAWVYEKNATGRVPVLEDGELVLPESAVILEYLEERFPEPPLQLPPAVWGLVVFASPAVGLLVYWLAHRHVKMRLPQDQL